MPYDPTYHFQRDITKKSYALGALASDRIREHKSEYLDDIKFQCGSLRSIADTIERAAVKLDNNRRAGKAWDSGAVLRELRQADNILTKLNLTAERLSE